MKIKYIVIIFISIVLSCSNHKEIIAEKYPNGHPRVVQTILSVVDKDTLKKVTGYRENGKVSFTGFYINDKLDSVFTQFHIDSYQVSERINYSHGRKNGLSAGWYIDGKKKYEVNYVMDYKNGIETTWYENGNKKSEGSLEEGKNVELWTYWYENGNKKEEGSYKGGEFEKLSPLSNKSTPDFIPFKHGKWTYWNEKGELIKTEYWQQGNLKDQ